ncbi:MAG: hypothetical protein PUF13_02985 [Lachnospiraceae bacterium]|nr:hypothetical protein [Lachnospiraceae bacterium]
MRNNEDYLDSLLNNVTKKLSEFDEDFEQKKQTSDAYMTKKNLPPKTMKALETVRENQFLREFEDELKQDDADSFLAEFEAELENEALEFEQTKEAQSADDDDAYRDQIEHLVSESQSEPQADEIEWMPGFDLQSDLAGAENEFPEDMLSDEKAFADMSDIQLEELPEEFAELPMEEEQGEDIPMPESDMPDAPPEGMEALGSLFDDIESEPEEEVPLEDSEPDEVVEETLLPEDEELDDEGIMNLLNGLSEDEALSDIGKMLEADEQSISLEDLGAEPENLTHAADLAESSQAAKSAKKEKKRGFFAKLLDLMFGEDEDDADDLQAVAEAGDLENISDENLEILRAMSGDMAEASEDKSEKKGKKEKKKKEKKKKEPKEKKPKEPKQKKPKKEKKPKEKAPREKPLPKGPVIMIWLLALSIFALVFLGNNMLMKKNALRASEQRFDRGDYVGSYEEFAGIKIGESETQMYERAKVLAGVQTELNAYYSMMEVRKLDLALDCLVRALGRSDLHMAGAEEWGVTTQMNSLVSEITMQLMDQFNVTADQARELYAIEERDDYSLALDEILKGLGLK